MKTRLCKWLALMCAVAMLSALTFNTHSLASDVTILGDVNFDKRINSVDASLVLLCSVEKITFTDDQIAAGDANSDGGINATDATLILLHTVGRFLLGTNVTSPTAPTATTTTTTTATPSESTTTTTTTAPVPQSYRFDRLIWSDEFDGDALDLTKWSYQHGTRDVAGNGPSNWGNSEGEYYTEEAVTVKDGYLTITAREWTDEDTAKYGQQGKLVRYTSARIRTVTDDKKTLFATTYGRIEARMKLPKGRDYWPAFWMMPVESAYGSWARSGELDIMESRGQMTSVVGAALHYGGNWPKNKSSSYSYLLPDGGLTTDFHVYAVEWEPTEIRWYVDGQLIYTMYSLIWYSDGSDSATAPFDREFYILLNLAVCGGYVTQEGPDPEDLPGEMVVDYVRAYACDPE